MNAPFDPPAKTVRTQLAEHSKAAHLALHQHPDLLLLERQGLHLEHYARILTAYFQFQNAVEAARNRLNLWPELSLRPGIEALASDIAALAPIHPLHLPRLGRMEERTGTLALLYVFTGAQFGGKVIAKALQSQNPAAPVGYFSLGSSPEKWRTLCAILEEEGQDPDALKAMKHTTRNGFETFGAYVSACCADRKTAQRQAM